MATRGRKPKPTALKLLEGTRSDRVNPAEPAPVAGLPECPAHLAGAAREEWDRIVPLLALLGVLSRTDGAALAIYCSTFGRWKKALEAIESKGLVITTLKGITKANPAVGIATAAEAAMHRMLVEFGCTPSSRSRLAVAGGGPKDELSEFEAKWKA